MAALLRTLAFVLLAAAALHAIHRYGKEHLGLSGDEYYFYYAASGLFVDQPSDPVWAMAAHLRSAHEMLAEAAARDPRCREATQPARSNLRELVELLRTETSGQGYGPSSVFQGWVLRAWNAFQPAATGSDPAYAASLGRRIAAGLLLSFGLVVVASFAGAAGFRSVTVLCALGCYVLLHALVPPAKEYWNPASQALDDPAWILLEVVAKPFANPWYPDSLFAIAPRGFLLPLMLLALACRWAGYLRSSYALLAVLPLFHAPIGTISLGMLVVVDLIARPRVFRDAATLVIAAGGCAVAALGHAGTVFLDLAGGRWLLAVAPACVAAAAAYVVWMPRQRWFAIRSDWWSQRVILLDVILFGPGFLLGWAVLAILHARVGIVTDYGLVQLGTKAAALAHHVFFFGLVAIVLANAAAALERAQGEPRAAATLMALSIALAVGVTTVLAVTDRNQQRILQRFASAAAHYDGLARTRPLNLGAFETHLMWHRIVRQRESGGDWIRGAIDLAPFRATCGLR